MTDWIPLREFLREWADEQIAAETDREARAVLGYHRERIIDRMELALLRQILAGREHAAERAGRAQARMQ